ncbi:zinc finger protein basonuclin-2-like isoform X2 [Lineus longissimus]|uniref:zinc finger protein basonuclin-2-like isoform X2 n=1 Tax=Lineus longissimus TaxID=88925 RepID=UPI00315CCBF6
MGDNTEATTEKPETPKLDLAIRCTLPNCSCECFAPGKSTIRVCETCKHGWVIHALDKLGYNSVYPLGMQVEIVAPNIVFDIASLMLYGTQATPIRLKILLDRLFSVLQHEEVLQVLHGFGWTYEDYARGYILQDRNGRVLDKWSFTNRDEEHIIIQQFLRFGETKAIAQEIILADTKERQEQLFRQSPKSDSDIKKFLERSNIQMHNFARSFDSRHGLIPVSRPAHTPSTTGSRIMSPTRGSTYSPGCSREREPSRPLKVPTQSTSPMSTSPLNRLSTMQPFDYRRDPIGTALAAGEKSHHPSVPFTSTPLSIPSRPIPNIPSLPGLPDIKPMAHVQTQPQDLSKSGSKAKKEEPISFSSPPLPSFSSPPGMSSSGMSRLHRPTDFSMSSPFSHHLPLNAGSHYADKKVKHLRKSANPMKRQWQPSASFGNNTLISPSGKKRVLCTACNKTFCDKGALKIHYSAVHLKEMHSCTVAGCNMLFSSRRSRNRHSANPNPKLHRPTKQKLPDGCSIIDDGSNQAKLLGARGTIAQRLFAHPGASDQSPATLPSSMLGMPPMMMDGLPMSSPSNDSNMSNDSDQAYYVDHNNRITLLPANKRAKLDMEDDDYDDLDDMDKVDSVSVDTDKTEDFHVKPDQEVMVSSSGSSRKRKSAMPTRVKQTEDVSDENNDDVPLHDMSRLAEARHEMLRLAESRLTEPLVEHSDDEMPLNLTEPTPKNDAANDADDESQEEAKKDETSDRKVSDDFDFNKNRVSDNESSLLEGNGFKEMEDNTIKKTDHLAQIGLRASKPESVDSGVVPDQQTSAGLCFFGHMPVTCAQPIFPDTDPLSSRPHSRNTDNGHGSDMESNASYGSDMDLSPGHSPSSGERERFDIPLDRDNPRQCVACGKLFQNQFGVKTHYQNVHLKLMHTCSVEGCNASFPSKRSRDRHSSNLNLHRKLLSTSGLEGERDGYSNSTQSLRDEFLSKIYDGNHYGGSIRENGQNHDKKLSEIDNDSYQSISPRPSSEESPEKLSSVSESLSLRSYLSVSVNVTEDGDHKTNGTKLEQDYSYSGSLEQDASPQPDPDGSVDCHICKERFRDNLVLKEHFEKVHPKEMYKCTITGCEKVFSTRKSRNRHSQNDNLHRHLMAGMGPTDNL